ncbi:MAG: hypothetical protein LUD84_06765 [Clostridiales bacterium]|nr:hypothetical protein [Clostridiales bacterium]
MDKIGLNLFLNDKTDASRLICGLRTVLKNEYEITAFNRSEYSVDEVVYKDGIPIMVIDIKSDEDVDIAADVIRMFRIQHDPIFMIVNYENLDDEGLSYAENTVGDVLLDCGLVKDPCDVRYETVFFSPENGGRAFRKAVESLADNAGALIDLLEWWNIEDE